MSSQIFKNIAPILAGFESRIRIQFAEEAWDEYITNTDRLVCHFRAEVNAEDVLFEASTTDDTIVRDPGHIIQIIIPEGVSADWADERRSVSFDIVRIDSADAKHPVPGIWRWPVRMRVTRDVE